MTDSASESQSAPSPPQSASPVLNPERTHATPTANSVQPTNMSTLHPPSQKLSLPSLLANLAHDKTKTSTANVKVAQSLLRDGTNTVDWFNHLVNAGITKECVEAFHTPMPGTRANAAAITLISSSTPSDWSNVVAGMSSAADALIWILNKFTGGHDRVINRVWLKELLELMMTREQSFEEFMLRKWLLFDCLKRNCHMIEEADVINAIIDCLPAEFESSKRTLYATCSRKSREEVLQIIRDLAQGIKFDDMTPRPPPKAAAARPTHSSKGERRPPRCWNCGEMGHLQRHCPKPFPEASRQPSPPAPCMSTQTASSSNPLYVTYNVLQPSCRKTSCEDWIVDSGASVHVVSDLSLLHNPTVYTEPQQLHLAHS